MFRLKGYNCNMLANECCIAAWSFCWDVRHRRPKPCVIGTVGHLLFFSQKLTNTLVSPTCLWTLGDGGVTAIRARIGGATLEVWWGNDAFDVLAARSALALCQPHIYLANCCHLSNTISRTSYILLNRMGSKILRAFICIYFCHYPPQGRIVNNA